MGLSEQGCLLMALGRGVLGVFEGRWMGWQQEKEEPRV